VNQKGGVGKTTTAINLAAYLSEMGFKTLLIDLDPQANATSGVGLKQDKIVHTIYDLLTGQCGLSEALHPSPFDHLHVIPASADLTGAEIEMVSFVSRETVLRQITEPLRDHYPFVIIDCPPSLGLLTLNALSASDSVIIPVQCEYFALEGLSGLLNTIQLVKEGLNPQLEIEGVLLTMFDKRTTFNRQIVQNATAFFDNLLFGTIIPRNIRLSEAPSHGLPIALYQPDSQGSYAYQKLAQEVVERVNKYETVPTSR